MCDLALKNNNTMNSILITNFKDIYYAQVYCSILLYIFAIFYIISLLVPLYSILFVKLFYDSYVKYT